MTAIFLDKTAERLFAFEGNGKLLRYEGGYSDYLEKKEYKETSLGDEKERTKETGKTEKVKTVKLRFTWQEQRDYESIEGEIEAIEERLSMLEGEI